MQISKLNQTDGFFEKLPSNWHFDRMKDIVSLRNEKTNEKSDMPDYLELEDIESGTGKLLSKRNTLEVIGAVTKFEKGDILFGKLRPYLQKYFLADFDGKCTGEILAFKPERIESPFLFYCIASSWFIDKCHMLSYGAKMPRVNWVTQLAAFDIPIPPRKEQLLIAAFLDKACAAIDAAIHIKRQQLDTLDALKKSIIHQAVTRGLDDGVELKDSGVEWLEKIPLHWNVHKLKRVAAIQTGITLGKKYSEALIERPYLRVANVQDGYLDLNEIKTVFVPESEAMGARLQEHDVLMTEGGDLDKLGRGYLWNGQIPDCLHQNHIFAIRCNADKLLPEFLTFITASCYGRVYFEATGKKTTNLASTNATKIRAFPLPLPPIKEQESIIISLREKMSQLETLKTNLFAQITTLADYRKALIHECVTGKRRIREADIF